MHGSVNLDLWPGHIHLKQVSQGRPWAWLGNSHELKMSSFSAGPFSLRRFYFRKVLGSETRA